MILSFVLRFWTSANGLSLIRPFTRYVLMNIFDFYAISFANLFAFSKQVMIIHINRIAACWWIPSERFAEGASVMGGVSTAQSHVLDAKFLAA